MEIDKTLRYDLLDERITSLLGGKFIYKLHKPENVKVSTYIEYLVVRNENVDFCGNANLEEENLLQIDVFSKDGALVSNIIKSVKAVLKEKGYRYEYGYQGYEEDTSLYTEKIRIYKEIPKEP